MSLIHELLKDKKCKSITTFIFRKYLFKKSKDEYLKKIEPFFVLSTGRAGTKSLSVIMSKSPEIVSFHEPTPLIYEISKKSYLFSDNINKSILASSFSLARDEYLKFTFYIDKKYLETSPHCTFLAPSIKRLLPNSKFIHLVRNPQNVIISGLNRGWYNGHPYDKVRLEPRPETYFSMRWDTYSLLEKNVWLWSETNTWIANYLDTLKESDKIIISSENLFNLYQPTYQKVFNFFGINELSKNVIESILSKKLNKNITNEVSTIDLNKIDKKLLTFYNTTKERTGY